MYNENQIVKMKWNNATKKYYKQLGYQFTKNGEIFEIKAKDLLPRSEIKIEVKCDYCDTIKYMSKGVYFRFTDEKVKEHDKIKNKYCDDKNIKLIRIPYWDIDKVEEILQQKIS